jgi:integrase
MSNARIAPTAVIIIEIHKSVQVPPFELAADEAREVISTGGFDRRGGRSRLMLALTCHRTKVLLVPIFLVGAYVGQHETDLLFTGRQGGVLRRGNFRHDSGWAAAVGKLGVPGVHFHDLRHTENMLAAPGASLGDLKARMGHDSARAATIYQHATTVADRAIADALDKRIEASVKGDEDRPDDDDDGLGDVLVPGG